MFMDHSAQGYYRDDGEDAPIMASDNEAITFWHDTRMKQYLLRIALLLLL